MKKLSNITLSQDKTLFDALKNLEKEDIKIIFIIDSKEKLLGTISDGDIRRNLINGKSLDSKVSEIMNTNFISAKKDDNKQEVLEIMKKKGVKQLPILNDSGKIIDVMLLEELIEVSNKCENPIIIMAGGIGSRLRPFTENCPKPMLKVGDKPILEILIEQLIKNGFSNFYISVNYLKEQIMGYFDSGSKWNVNIKYLIEDEPLGTAGALSLLPRNFKEPFVVLNGDILTKFNIHQLVDFHSKNKSFTTICAREYEIKIPFGVIKSEGIELKEIIEKPSYKSFVNAGVYAFNAEVLKLIPKNQPLDMPDLINKVKLLEKRIVICPIHEYWIDIGRHETLNQAHQSWIK
tara:strand:+ start:911 stop:1954 length:1044 start_codon:yes stop_codon:yes gene_type:complete